MGTIFQRLAATALAAAFLAGCMSAPGQPSTGQPTSAPTAGAPQPTVVSQPTTPAQPTAGAQPTAPAKPTAQPNKRPAFGFDPQGGAAGTKVSLSGWDFAPGSDVAVRLGLPNPVGEALTSARVDAAGRWSGSFVLPGELPSGDPVPAGQVTLVVMDANTNAALASAPFGFEPPAGPSRAQASQTIADFLHAIGTREAWDYLASNLDHSLPLEQSLGLRHHFVTYEVGAALDRPSEVLIVPATLVGEPQRHYYEFALVVENGAWKIRSASWLRTEQPASEDPAAAQPGQYDYSNIATVLDRALRQNQEYSPLIVGAVAVAGNYAAAYALPYPGNKQFAYLRQAPGAGWEVVLVTGAPTAEQLARAGIPRTLLVSGDVPAIVDTVLAHYNSSAYGGADGWVSVEGIEAGFARATLHRGEAGDLAIFLQSSQGGWKLLIDGQAFAPEALDQLGIPASLR